MIDIIYCCDCFYYDPQTRFCWMLEQFFDEDFFCAYGQGFEDNLTDSDNCNRDCGYTERNI